MKSHRTIWYITGGVVVLTALFAVSRDTFAPRKPGTSAVHVSIVDVSPARADQLVQTMLKCLEQDPAARRRNTRRIVEAVAALAEQGVLDTAETEYALGVRYFGQRKLAEGEQAFKKAIAFRPDWHMPYNGLGILLHAAKRFDESEAAFKKAIELAPDQSRAYNDLAILLRLTGRLDEAEAYAKRALELDPNTLPTHNNYGNLLVAQHRFEEAEAAYERASELEPDHPAPYYNLACLASLRGDADRAVALLHTAIVLDDRYRAEATDDEDFDPIRESAEFRSLVLGEH
jgi:Flp pilus assembly protein TadD